MATIRFSVGTPTGPRSAIWRIWNAKKTSDVYLESRDVQGVMKFSLHQTGMWHYGFRSEYIRAQKEAGTWRERQTWWKEWNRPAPFALGYTLAIKFLVSGPAVVTYHHPLPTKKDIQWTAPPPDGKAIVFSVTFVAAGYDDPFAEGETAKLVGTLALPNGEAVMVHSHLVDGLAARREVLRCLTEFCANLASVDTNDLAPFEAGSVIVGFSSDTIGAELVTECPLNQLPQVWCADMDDGEREPSPVADGEVFEFKLVAPPEIFDGIDLQNEHEKAQAAFEKWRAAKLADFRRLFGNSTRPSSG